MSGLTKDELRELAEKIIKNKSTKRKAAIVKVGIVANGQPAGFEFDCGGTVAAIEVRKGGQILYGGWTVDELAGLSLAGNLPHGEAQ